MQLFLIYLALPQIGVNLDRTSLVNFLTLTTFVAGVIGLGLNYGAYMTEIFRAGIQSVGHGQAEAADALGMTLPTADAPRRAAAGDPRDHPAHRQRVHRDDEGHGARRLPRQRRWRNAELFLRAQLAFSGSIRNRLESLLVAAALYWMLTSIFTFFQSRLERRISKGYVRTEVATGTGRKRTQFIPAADRWRRPGGGARQIAIEIPTRSDAP